MHTVDKARGKTSSIVEAARKLAEDSSKPMSIDQIRAKFDPPFTFQVKKVVGTPGPTDWPIGQVVTITAFDRGTPGFYEVDRLPDTGELLVKTPADIAIWVLV